MKDYYHILSVSRDASQEEIKRAYRALARRYHPDRSNDVEAEERFKEITEAYAVLIDPERRARYDREGILADPRELANEVRKVFWEILGDLFPAARKRARKRDGKEVRTKVVLTLEEAVSGATREVTVPRRRACRACQGEGGVLRIPPAHCPSCSGKGEVKVRQGLFHVTRECEQCRGRGAAFESRCKECLGRGEKIVSVPLSLTFPPGLKEGQVITVRGAGFPGEGGGKDGDLDVEITFAAHPFFTEKDGDFWVDVPVRLDEALLGARVPVPTPDGEILLKVPPNTQSGRTLKVSGRGGVSPRGGRGDLLVRVLVETPSLPPQDHAALLEILQRAHHEKRQQYLRGVEAYFAARAKTPPEEETAPEE